MQASVGFTFRIKPLLMQKSVGFNLQNKALIYAGVGRTFPL